MKKIFIGLFALATISSQSFAVVINNPLLDGKPFEATKQNADIACYLLNNTGGTALYKAKSFETAKISHKDLPEACSVGFPGERVGVVSKHSSWVTAHDFIMPNTEMKGETLVKTAQVFIEAIPFNADKKIKVISRIECE